MRACVAFRRGGAVAIDGLHAAPILSTSKRTHGVTFFGRRRHRKILPAGTRSPAHTPFRPNDAACAIIGFVSDCTAVERTKKMCLHASKSFLAQAVCYVKKSASVGSSSSADMQDALSRSDTCMVHGSLPTRTYTSKLHAVASFGGSDVREMTADISRGRSNGNGKFSAQLQRYCDHMSS